LHFPLKKSPHQIAGEVEEAITTKKEEALKTKEGEEEVF
jgi:hypothetical protein